MTILLRLVAPPAARQSAGRGRQRARRPAAASPSARSRGAPRPPDRRLRGRRGHDDAAPADRRLQRPRGALRPPVRRGRAGGHPQLDGRAAAGLVRLRAGRADRRPARGRHPRPADRHLLRGPAAQRPAAHGRRRRPAAPEGRGGRRERGDDRRGAAAARPGRLQGRGRARHVPLPLVLRARRHAGRRGARRPCATSSSPTPATSWSSSTRTRSSPRTSWPRSSRRASPISPTPARSTASGRRCRR